MATIDKCFILEQNNEEIRKRIEDAGIRVWDCATRVGGTLIYHTDGTKGVHGMITYRGDKSDTHTTDEEWIMANAASDIIFCKDVDDFINHIKEFELCK